MSLYWDIRDLLWPFKCHNWITNHAPLASSLLVEERENRNWGWGTPCHVQLLTNYGRLMTNNWSHTLLPSDTCHVGPRSVIAEPWKFDIGVMCARGCKCSGGPWKQLGRLQLNNHFHLCTTPALPDILHTSVTVEELMLIISAGPPSNIAIGLLHTSE